MNRPIELLGMPTLVEMILNALPLNDLHERYFRAHLPPSPILSPQGLFGLVGERWLGPSGASTSSLLPLPSSSLGVSSDPTGERTRPEAMGDGGESSTSRALTDAMDLEHLLVHMYGFDLDPEELDQLENRLDPQPTPTVSSLIADGAEVETLGSRILRNILRANFVTFPKDASKADLIQGVERLRRNMAREISKYISIAGNEETARWGRKDEKDTDETSLEKKNQVTEEGRGIKVTEDQEGESLCRVCCDAMTSCLFLECAHLVVCLSCARQLKDQGSPCPICRQPITRIVQVFRA